MSKMRISVGIAVMVLLALLIPVLGAGCAGSAAETRTSPASGRYAEADRQVHGE